MAIMDSPPISEVVQKLQRFMGPFITISCSLQSNNKTTNYWGLKQQMHKSVYECLILYYIYSMPPTYYGHTCGHPQGSELQRIC